MSMEFAMSRPDYEQTILHHRYLLVLLRGVGPSKPRSLQQVFDKVRKINNVKITDSNGLVRQIWVRYIHDYPVENNDWGDFQTHRRLLGLITIGKFENQNELNELCRQHESLKVRYSSTLYESRAIFFGPALHHQENIANVHVSVLNNSDKNSDNLDSCEAHNDERKNCVENINPTLREQFNTPSNFKSQVFFYNENDFCADLDGNVVDFVNALFWILECKRLDRSREKAEKYTLLKAPFEEREVVGLDMESRSNRKRILGRITKNLADLSLQAGLIENALTLYHNACDTLRSTMDSLWVGAAEEGLCSASACLLYCHLHSGEIFRRNASLQVGLCLKIISRGASDMTKSINTQKKNTIEQPDYILSHASSPQSPMHSTCKSSVSPILNKLHSNVTAPHYHNTQGELPGNILKPEDLHIYFQKAIINYSKYRHAAIIGIEASFKSARISIEQNRALDVAMVLQNILYINHNLSESECIRLFEMMTTLYQQIGYRRKAAFFQRLAALKYIQQSSVRLDWSQTYRLLLASLSGYMLSLDPLEVLLQNTGWPTLQIDILQNLIWAARQLDQGTLATRHMTFLLQTQWHNMNIKNQSEMALQLQNISVKCEGSPVPLVLENGTVIPPANLTDLPYCLRFTIEDLPPHLKPQRLKTDKRSCGPFLFTPLQFNSTDSRNGQKEKNKMSFSWVQNTICEVKVCLQNPLPFELVVNDMRLLTNGAVFKSVPQTVMLSSETPTNVTLHGTPIESGQLDIQGYSTHTLGVKSNCRLKYMYDRDFPQNYLIDVIPPLPCIYVKTSLPQTPSFSNMVNKDIVVSSASLSLYEGEFSTCIVTITNESMVPVEHFEMHINSNLSDELQKEIFHIDEENIQSKLPILPHSSIDFEIEIFAYADFVAPMVIKTPQNRTKHIFQNTCSDNTSLSSEKNNLHQIQTSLMSSLQYGKSVPSSKVSIQQQQQKNMKNNDASNFRSNKSNQSIGLSLSNINDLTDCTSPTSHSVEAQLCIKYSGGEAMCKGFCRECAIFFNLEFLASVQITGWDVLPAEMHSKFYLVLDVANLTIQEMSLNYTQNKNILIEAKEICRVPIPVDRCTLKQINDAIEMEIANQDKAKCINQLKSVLTYNKAVSLLCSNHIAEKVKIKWCLTGTNVNGVALLKGIVLTQTMIDLCTVSPLRWNVTFKNQSVLPQSDVICVAGQSSILGITISNQSLQVLRNLILTIKFYQDYLNGIENYNLETRVAISGPNQFYAAILEKNKQCRYECCVVFFTPGRFKVNIQCQAEPQFISQNNSPSLNVELNEVQLKQSTTVYKTESGKICGDEQKQIWKFIPPIEVTVIEQQ